MLLKIGTLFPSLEFYSELPGWVVGWKIEGERAEKYICNHMYMVMKIQCCLAGIWENEL